MKEVKKYLIGFIIGLLGIGTFAYAADRGNIGVLFNEINGEWFLNGENIANNTIAEGKLDNDLGDKIDQIGTNSTAITNINIPDVSDFVDKTTDQTIAGTKTFINNITIDDGAVDGAGITFKSEGNNDYSIDNSAGSLRFFQPGREIMNLNTDGELILKSGAIKWSNSKLTNNQGGSIELGGSDVMNEKLTPYIDFSNNLDDTDNNDYDGRIILSDNDTLKIDGASLNLSYNSDVSSDSPNPPFMIGSNNSTNLGMDNNEIIARNNGEFSTLYLNLNNETDDKIGGNVDVGGNLILRGGIRGINTSCEDVSDHGGIKIKDGDIYKCKWLDASSKRFLKPKVDGIRVFTETQEDFTGARTRCSANRDVTISNTHNLNGIKCRDTEAGNCYHYGLNTYLTTHRAMAYIDCFCSTCNGWALYSQEEN